MVAVAIYCHHQARESEARVTDGRPSGLPATAGRGVVGAPGSSRLLPIHPAPSDVTSLLPLITA